MASSRLSPGGRVRTRLFGAHLVLSHEDEPYGLISHSKYTNPTAMADTTTRCMNILPRIDCCHRSDAGNQRLD